MPSTRPPTLRAVRLGQELRKLREDSGIGMRELASDLDVNIGRLSKKESGKLPAKQSDVDDYLRACNVHDPSRRDALSKICLDVLRKGWWDGYIGDIASTLMDRIWMESVSERIDTFATIMIPGLLQTPRYADALMRVRSPEVDENEIERWIEVRTTRQHVLTRHDPIRYRVVLDEATLKRHVGGAETMREQLNYLAKAASQENISIRVLPFSSGMHPSLTGAFEVLTLEDPYPPAGLLQVPDGDMCVEGDTIDVLTEMYNKLLDAALSPTASKKAILTERDRL